MTQNRPDVTARPPVARRQPTKSVIHGRTLDDPYAWLRRRDDPEVRAYLEAEKAYTARSMRHAEPLREQLYRELVGRLQETDSTVPVRRGNVFYYSRTEKGRQYPIRCRRRGSLEAPEEALLDLNAIADDGAFLALGAFEVSPDHRLLAYSLNDDGSESFTLRVLDLESRRHVGEPIAGTSTSVVWANDSRTLFYATKDAARRPYRAFRRRLGSEQPDEQVFHEADERFFLSLFVTRSRRFVGLRLDSKVTTEIHLLDADATGSDFQPLFPRRQGVELEIDHSGDSFYVLTNQDAPNFKLMRVPVSRPEPEHWVELVAHRDDVQLESVDCFARHRVLSLRRGGLRRLRVTDLETGEDHEIDFDQPTYTVALEDNPEFDTAVVRFACSSPTIPRSVFDYDMARRRRELRKRTEVIGYDSERYACERIWARAADGTRVPISLVYPKGIARDGSHPALLTAYGAYGTSNEPRFVDSRVSLLERGFVVAIAHVRGGGEMGRAWYEDGKLMKKENTFSDFIAAAEHLVECGYTSPGRLAIRGGSAGGLLIGAVLNRRPDLFAAAVADVPFVDVLNTMLDPTMPLTVIEFEEWGNPADPEVFDYIRGYSPYDNVARQDYPHLLVTAGLNDPRVQYWEPAKWVAKLRALETGHRRLLLEVDMESGHGGASGRYDSLRQEAFRLAFLLDSLGVA